MPRYVKSTTVPVAKSRQEIDKLLRDEGCDGFQWTDEIKEGLVTLRFTWTYDNKPVMVRIVLRLPTRAQLDAEACSLRGGKWSEAKHQRLLKAYGRQEHRVLLLWLKAAFNAVDAGLATTEDVLLSHIECQGGRTVGDLLCTRLTELPTTSPIGLLGGK